VRPERAEEGSSLSGFLGGKLAIHIASFYCRGRRDGCGVIVSMVQVWGFFGCAVVFLGSLAN
jgi:hypothetical protein